MLETTRKLLEYLVENTKNSTLKWKSDVTSNGYIKYYVNIPNTRITYIYLYDCFGKPRTMKMFVMQDDITYHIEHNYSSEYGKISQILYGLALELLGEINFQLEKQSSFIGIISSIINHHQ